VVLVVLVVAVLAQ